MNTLIKWAVLPLVIGFIIGLMLFEVALEVGRILQRRYLCRIDGLFNDWLGFDRGKKYP